MSTDPLLRSYEETPYPSLCYTQTHPNRLATLSALLGQPAAPVDQCRVLELGCAGGGNLIPMAYALPQSSFVGVDFSPAQIAAAQQLAADLGLTNLTFHAADILQIGPDFGQFDYIIAHGVYSWVPPQVRDKVLAICRANLAPEGIAYVSYNTYPGWHMMGMLREMMLYHIRDTADPTARMAQARELLAFLRENVASDDPYSTFSATYRQLLQTYADFVERERQQEQRGDQLLLHDELETFNKPVYFHEFVDHAAQHGLQYLVEAELSRVMPTNFPPETRQKLAALAGDAIALEQYMDFLRNRTFRQTLLVHGERPLSRQIQGDLRPFFIATYARPEEAVTLHDGQTARFRAPNGSVLSTDHPVVKAAMLHLADVAPTAVSFLDLLAEARQRAYDTLANDTLPGDAQALTVNLLQATSYSGRLVELHRHPPQFALKGGERPYASAVARWQAAHDYDKVSNLRHERVNLDPLAQHLLPYLDGSHNREALLDVLDKLAKQGLLKTEQNGRAVTNTVVHRQLLRQELAVTLQWLGRAALLEK